jgi:hypothetical protein
VSITLNFTPIFAWIGAITCAIIAIWLLVYLAAWVRALLEVLGIWRRR